jgi:hypothetical protein
MRYNPILHGHAAAWDDERKHYKGKGGSAPKTPNYSALATQQAELDRQAAERNVLANRANQYTPWGSLTWTQEASPVTYDDTAYQNALNAWNKGGGSGGGSSGIWDYIGGIGGQYRNRDTGAVVGYNPTSAANGGSGSSRGAMPTREQFRTGGGNTGKWSQRITLNPNDQARLEAQQKSQRALAENAQGMLGRIKDAYSKEFNWEDAPDIRELNLGNLPGVWDADWTKANPETGGMAIDTVKNALMSRIAPDLLRNREREEAQMIAQGVGRGANEAWNKSQTTLGRNENDAAMQALLSGIGEYGNIRKGQGDWRNQVYGELTDQYNRDILDRDRYIKEQKAQRDLPMDEYLRLMNAAGEVQMPNFPGYNQMGQPNAANQVGAAQDTFNSQMQKYNAGQQASGNFWNTAASLAGTAASLYL